MRLHIVFLSSSITRLVLGIVPMDFFPRTPSFTNLSSVDAPDPLTGHSYLLHTLHDFVGTRGLTFVRNVPLLPTYASDCLSSSVCNLMRCLPIPLLLLASGVRRSPLIYPANRIRSDRRPRRIRCYKRCSIHSGLWCWGSTTQAASDDAPSQRRGCISKKNQFALFPFQRTLQLLAAFRGTIFLKLCNQKTRFILRLI